MKKKGLVLVVIVFVVAILIILAASSVLRTIQEKTLAQQEKERLNALNLAEACVDNAVVKLRQDFNWTGTGTNVVLGSSGEYNAAVSTTTDSSIRQIDCTAFVPNQAGARETRKLEVYVKQVSAMPGNFFDQAVYSADKVELKMGDNSVSPTINGDVRYAGNLENNQGGVITGTATQDTTISPLVRLDFTTLKATSQAQGNFYNAARMKNIEDGSETFPSSFWYDQATSTPNVIYIEDNLELKNDIGVIGGFFIVVGDVLTNPDGKAEAEIKGWGTIAGAVYTLGEFEVKNESGNPSQVLTVNGGVWSADETELKGNTTLQYNSAYMAAIQGMDLGGSAQVVSWREKN